MKKREKINRISIDDAIKIASSNGFKISFDTKESEIKKFARNFLRKNKK